MNDHALLEAAVGLMGIGVGLICKLVVSIAELNKNVAVIVSRVDSHEKRLDNVDGVLTGLHGQIKGA